MEARRGSIPKRKGQNVDEVEVKRQTKTPTTPNRTNKDELGQDTHVSTLPSCPKASHIPRLKVDKNNKKEVPKVQPKQRPRPASTGSKCSRPTCESENALKLRQITEKEKSIAEYYAKIEELISRVLEEDKAEREKVARKTEAGRRPRKMTSDPVLFDRRPSADSFADIDKGVHHISNVWLKTSTDLANALESLKTESLRHTMESEADQQTVQSAIRKVKSFTLQKTRDVISEARKLLSTREKIRTKMERVVNGDFAGTEPGPVAEPVRQPPQPQPQQQRRRRTTESPGPRPESREPKAVEPTQVKKVSDQDETTWVVSERPPPPKRVEYSPVLEPDILDKSEPLNSIANRTDKDKPSNDTPSSIEVELNTWSDLLGKNKRTIGALQNRIFELQRACNGYSLTCNELQLKLVNFSRKIQYDEILIGKMRTLGEDESVRLLESELEATALELPDPNLEKLNEELNVVKRLDRTLVKEKCLLNHQGSFIGTRSDESDESTVLADLNVKCATAKSIIGEKQNVIDQLREIVHVMRDQEILSQTRKERLEAEIEERRKMDR